MPIWKLPCSLASWMVVPQSCPRCGLAHGENRAAYETAWPSISHLRASQRVQSGHTGVHPINRLELDKNTWKALGFKITIQSKICLWKTMGHLSQTPQSASIQFPNRWYSSLPFLKGLVLFRIPLLLMDLLLQRWVLSVCNNKVFKSDREKGKLYIDKQHKDFSKLRYQCRKELILY